MIRAAVLALALAGPGAEAAEFARPEPVVIEGYDGQAMEPFLTRDGLVLLFNNSNDPSVNTDLHWAERITPTRFRYRGRIAGVNTGALEGVPSVDRDGMLYFVSTRSYGRTFSTLYRGAFAGGAVESVELVGGVSRTTPGQVNFDAEISADGTRLYAVDGTFSGGAAPDTADIFVARRTGEGFRRMEASDAIMAAINTDALEYAPATSADERELFFTRLTWRLVFPKLEILHATRAGRDEPFGEPEVIAAISGFVEAPTVGPEGRSLYYHEKVRGMHRIVRVTRSGTGFR